MDLQVRDVARILNVSEKTLYRWIKAGTIPFHQVGDLYRFNRAEILEWATATGIQISPEILAEPGVDQEALPSLLDAVRAGGIAYGVGGTDSASVLAAVVEVLQVPEDVDRQFLYQVLLARETLGSTAVGDGIAIPHVRNPIVLHTTQPTITLCFLETPIAFGALDGVPVKILFTLISPTVQAHLHLLSRLAFVLRQPEFKAALQREAPRQELLEKLALAEAGLPAAPPARPV
jgi:PTS system nitrogen regulatory IIA component